MRGRERYVGDLADIDVNMDNVAYVRRTGDAFQVFFVGGWSISELFAEYAARLRLADDGKEQ